MPVRECGELERALRAGRARRPARGEVVLLSPACASFDQFADFEARGERFRRARAGICRDQRGAASKCSWMPAARSTARRASGAASGAGLTRARAGTAAAARNQPLEHRILLTATLCLLAFGAVMVYSASSATSLLQGRGNGSGYLIKYLVYGAIGLVVMRVLARDGVAKVQAITAPLLVVSFVLVLAVHMPHVGVSVNGARRWLGPGRSSSSPRSC